MTISAEKRRKKTVALLVKGYQAGIDDAIAVVWKYFQNDWHGGEAIAELKKLKEESR
jgi:hypothetical protein